MRKSGVRVCLALAIGMLCGCADHSAFPLNEQVAVPAARAVAAPANYLINPLDVLRIDVFGEPELSFATLPVNTDGQIVMPMIGTVTATGVTAGQLATQIGQRLNTYLRNPKVSVNVIEFTSQKVTVSGAVARPGQYQSPGGLTLMEAVAVGGGINDGGRPEEVVVFRQQGTQRFAARFDLRAIAAGQAADPTLQSGDIVVVGFSNARRIFRDVLAVLPLAVGVFVALYR